jgi:hypothetical protein
MGPPQNRRKRSFRTAYLARHGLLGRPSGSGTYGPTNKHAAVRRNKSGAKRFIPGNQGSRTNGLQVAAGRRCLPKVFVPLGPPIDRAVRIPPSRQEFRPVCRRRELVAEAVCSVDDFGEYSSLGRNDFRYLVGLLALVDPRGGPSRLPVSDRGCCASDAPEALPDEAGDRRGEPPMANDPRREQPGSDPRQLDPQLPLYFQVHGGGGRSKGVILIKALTSTAISMRGSLLGVDARCRKVEI